MDQLVVRLIDNSIIEILEMPMFVNMPESEKNKLMQKLQGHFYDVVLDSFIEQLDNQQVSVLLNIPLESPELEEKIIEYSKANPLITGFNVLFDKFICVISFVFWNNMSFNYGPVFGQFINYRKI